MTGIRHCKHLVHFFVFVEYFVEAVRRLEGFYVLPLSILFDAEALISQTAERRSVKVHVYHRFGSRLRRMATILEFYFRFRF